MGILVDAEVIQEDGRTGEGERDCETGTTVLGNKKKAGRWQQPGVRAETADWYK